MSELSDATRKAIEGKTVNEVLNELLHRSWWDDEGHCWVRNFDDVDIRMPEGDHTP